MSQFNTLSKELLVHLSLKKINNFIYMKVNHKQQSTALIIYTQFMRFLCKKEEKYQTACRAAAARKMFLLISLRNCVSRDMWSEIFAQALDSYKYFFYGQKNSFWLEQEHFFRSL